MMRKRWEENLAQMMRDRGVADWRPSTADETVFLADQILIYFCPNEKFNIESVKYLVYQLNHHRRRHGIVVYHNLITSSARKAIDHLHDFVIEMFESREVLYNPTRHRLYCPHLRLEKDAVRAELPHLQLSNLPILLRTDMIARYFHFLKGDVIRIERKNGSIAYRLVK